MRVATTLARNTTTALASAIAEPWLAWLGDYAAPTREAYMRDLRQWESWCVAHGVQLLNPKPGHVTQWIGDLRAMGRTDATVARKVSTLASFYRWARHNGLTAADPMPLKRPRVHTDGTAKLGLERDRLRAVLAEAKRHSLRAHALVTLLIFTGLRISEALHADVSDLSEQAGHRVLRVVGKGSRPRTVVLPAPVWHVLQQYLGERTGPIFITASGKRLGRQSAHATIRLLGSRVGVALHPHLLRHSAATAALDSGAPLDRVQALLGHASPTVTMRYAKARDQLNNSAAFDLARYLG